MKRLFIPRCLYDLMIDHARNVLPAECCGLLVGRVEGDDGQVTMQVPLRNSLGSPTEFLSDPRDMLAAYKLMRDKGFELLAVYHSHPTSPPIPSRRDLERNTYPEAVCLIVSMQNEPPESAAWWLRGDEYIAADWQILSENYEETPRTVSPAPAQ